MNYRAYFKLRFKLLSPLSIGGSFSKNSDKDVILDSRGKPIIPAASIAGVLRSLADDKDDLFGCMEKDGKERKVGRLVFYDAALNSEHNTAIRDCVALDEYKTAKHGAKFDFQAVEPGAEFIGFAEARSKEAKEKLEALLARAFCLGSKTTRGYGKIELAYLCKEFQAEQLKDWLDFDIFDWPDTNWTEITPQAGQIRLRLRQRGGLSIRQYMTEADDENNKEINPDCIPMALHDENNVPVIPGTSWAGMFRHHMETLLGRDLRCVFGFVNEKMKICQKSKITFSESQIKNGTSKQLTRNMIDRFTNGTKDGALYTEQTVYDGDTSLEITLDNDVPSDAKYALYATILDLHGGYVALGGSTAVGRGLFKVTEINEKPFVEGNFKNLKEAIGCD